MKEEFEYLIEERADLIARIMGAQALNQFLMRAYSVMRSYEVDFMELPEWKDQSTIDKALKLKPRAAQELIIAYISRLENALSAAVRRKQFRLHHNKHKD